MSHIDMTFRLNAQAWATLHLLNALELDDGLWDEEAECHHAEIRTAPWFNGRERGFSLVVTTDRFSVVPALTICFAECRNSDEIVVFHWVSPISSINPPTANDLSESAWDNRKFFRTPSVAADGIWELINNWLLEQQREEVA